MKKNTIALIAFIVLMAQCFFTIAQSWQPVGPDDNKQLYPGASTPLDASFANGTPYVLLAPQSSGSVIPVVFRQLNAVGTAWQTLIGGNANGTSVTGIIAADNTPYFAYLDGNTGDKLCVQKGNLSTGFFAALGKQDFTTGQVKNAVIAVNGQTPYVAFSDVTNGNKLTVMKLDADGVDWDIVGNAGFSVSTVDNISMAFVGTNTYIAFRDYGTGSTPLAKVMMLNAAGTTWQNAGPAAVSNLAVSTLSFAVNNGTPYVAYTPQAGIVNNNTVVLKLNAAGTAWVNVGTAPVPGEGLNVRLQFDQSTPYIAYNDFANNYQESVFMLNAGGTAWQAVGNADLSSGNALNSILRISNDKPYLFFSDEGYLSVSRAMTLNTAGTTWQDITTAGFSAAEPHSPNIVINNGTPYVAYADGPTYPNLATVMKFNGNQWQVMGTPRFAFMGNVPDKMPLVFVGSIPYVVYEDGNQSDQLSVKRLNTAGTGWEQVGDAGFAPDAGTTGISIVSDGTNTYASAGATVMKLDAGDVWQSAGQIASDAGESISNASLAINNSTLYIVYRSLSMGGIKVKKLNASGGWDLVGGGVFGTSTAEYLSLVFNNSVPYVCSSVALYQLNATATGWVAIGSLPFMLYPQLAFEGNVPYISFTNDLGGPPAEVIYYDATGKSWKILGTGSNNNIAAGSVYSNSIAIANNQVYDVMDEGDAFAKVYGLSPVVSSFSPTNGPQGTLVTIKGKNFFNVQSVTFGGEAAQSFTIVSDSVMTAVVGTGSSGSVSVTSLAGTGQLAGFTFAVPLPTITSVTPTQATQNTPVTITGTNLSGATAVTFGGVPATSFKINSATGITAITGTGKSGDVIVTTSAGSASFSGFTYLTGPVINSFTPVLAEAGASVQITGAGFTGATAVTFGGQAAQSFIVKSSTSITAVVGNGATGSVAIATPDGTASLAGFTFALPPVPNISSFTPVNAKQGDTVTIFGGNFDSVSAVSFGGIPAAAFFERDSKQLVAVVGNGSSGDISVTTPSGTGTLGGFTYIAQLPPGNFSVAVTSATCRGNSDGMIAVSAVQPLSYTAVVTGNGINKSYAFSSAITIDSLAAGTYNLCINYQSGYSSCYTLVVNQPQDLSVYTVVSGNTLNLHMSGGDLYNINVNGKPYLSTTDSTATITLPEGNTDITVSTDKYCQGMVEKLIGISNKLIPYPNPTQSIISINLGDKTVKNVTIDMHAVDDGRQVYFKQSTDITGVLQVDLSGLENGIYIFHISADGSENVFKIIKN